MNRALPVLAFVATLLLSSCGNKVPNGIIDISGVNVPPILREIVTANRATIFAPLAPNFWETATGFLTAGFNREENLRIAETVRQRASKHRTWFGVSEYPSGVPSGTISKTDAASDIDFFFDILRYGYAGYG
ncbi:MAG: hypothetical protein FWD94_07055, partial [Treponema sp.]|nr:hypothetical protein [Treponema sp.]